MAYKYCLSNIPADLSHIPALTIDIHAKNKYASRDVGGNILGEFNFDTLRRSLDGTTVLGFQDDDEPWSQILIDSLNVIGFLSQAEADALIATAEWTDPNDLI